MSEGSTGAVAPGSAARSQEAYWAAVLLLVVSLAGPLLGLIFGKGSGLIDGLRAGWYSLPLAAFAAMSLVVRIKSPQDYFGGVALAALALLALWAGSDLPGMRGFAFGPGTAPRLFAYSLLGLGVVVALIGLLMSGPPSERYSFTGPFGGAILIVMLIPITMFAARQGRNMGSIPTDVVVAFVSAVMLIGLALLLMRFVPRGPLFITAATLIFASSVRPLGLVISSFVSIVVSAAATEEVRWVETMIWAAVLTVFCAVLFPYGLNLPLQLWPRF